MIFRAHFLRFASSVTCQPLHLPAPFLEAYLGMLLAGVARRDGETHLLHRHRHLKPPKSQLFRLSAAGPLSNLSPRPGDAVTQARATGSDPAALGGLPLFPLVV